MGMFGTVPETENTNHFTSQYQWYSMVAFSCLPVKDQQGIPVPIQFQAVGGFPAGFPIERPNGIA